jgi:hypothetical protein
VRTNGEGQNADDGAPEPWRSRDLTNSTAHVLEQTVCRLHDVEEGTSPATRSPLRRLLGGRSDADRFMNLSSTASTTNSRRPLLTERRRKFGQRQTEPSREFRRGRSYRAA